MKILVTSIKAPGLSGVTVLDGQAVGWTGHCPCGHYFYMEASVTSGDSNMGI